MSTDYSTTPADDYQERTQDAITPVAVAVVAAEPLRIVQHPAREFTTGSAAVLPGQVVQLVGAAPWRDSVRFANSGPGTIYLGPDRDTLTPGGGYPLLPGTSLTLRTRHAVYVLGAPENTQAAVASFLAEYVDG
ncbi:hypothetical protein [Streptomyces sp. GZWMJZ-114]|uniref:hypothetical protein n=1 Tax=Streptomyces sp. GZWMJZ-114 TaxID=2494734 RepID=UPI00101052AF|nr:hypothetical protein [Streptomyces sp. GZWMJZ-114]